MRCNTAVLYFINKKPQNAQPLHYYTIIHNISKYKKTNIKVKVMYNI